jgi:kojibiose phosphorylase
VLEQHEEYFKLRSVRITRSANGMPVVPLAVRDRQQTTQLIKQADIVLLQFLFGDEFDLKSKRVNYAYYAPRTMHQSSLSPSTYAIMGVEVGDMREAWRNFRRTAFMDLEDRQDSVAKGIHAAALGGTWMAVVNGFAGMRLGMSGALSFAPRLPRRWRRIRFRVSWRGARLQLTCTAHQVLVEHLGGGRGRARFRVWDTEVAIRAGERRRVASPTA